jgi:hypothetical protein
MSRKVSSVLNRPTKPRIPPAITNVARLSLPKCVTTATIS